MYLYVEKQEDSEDHTEFQFEDVIDEDFSDGSDDDYVEEDDIELDENDSQSESEVSDLPEGNWN